MVYNSLSAVLSVCVLKLLYINISYDQWLSYTCCWFIVGTQTQNTLCCVKKRWVVHHAHFVFSSLYRRVRTGNTTGSVSYSYPSIALSWTFILFTFPFVRVYHTHIKSNVKMKQQTTNVKISFIDFFCSDNYCSRYPSTCKK